MVVTGEHAREDGGRRRTRRLNKVVAEEQEGRRWWSSEENVGHGRTHRRRSSTFLFSMITFTVTGIIVKSDRTRFCFESLYPGKSTHRYLHQRIQTKGKSRLLTSISFMLGIANLQMHQMDVKIDLLNEDLEEIYMEQPKGFVAQGKENKMCKLVNTLYGLKQAPKQ
ncbi:hypothetical protein OSB04_014178 [Centaurea solstitialis]|uniref:Reverse transcriptase Ty1/copia-type domain-containing protein n=1 Tax=Centaurea solstitialis TaxID=347529 RepID=A0AA38TGF8_9ASTR|nr:hypothetical protein OSB04_014178 [Centaurea solstitialis]